MSNNNSICYEAIQRVYRNAVVRLIRNNLRETFPEDWSEKLHSLFTKEEWDRIRANARSTRASGQLNTPLIDDFDLLSVSHFFNIFDKYYSVLLKNNSEENARELKIQKEKLLSWIKTIKDLRDPLMHPGEDDFTREDSFLLLDCARRVLLRAGLLENASEIRALMDRLLGTHSIHSKAEPLEDELPPRESIVIDFVGRESELGELWEWFDDPVSRRWALVGEGGKGKSALAYNFAFEVKLKAPLPFQTVLWLSAKRRRFLEGTTKQVGEPDFFDLESALSRLLTYYGWVEEISNPTESKRIRTLELLTEFPALIIVDDVDSIESENESVIEFFSLQVTQTKSKVLFTSRRVPFGMGGTKTRVAGFSNEDAEKFILSRCQLLDLDAAVFDRATIQSMTLVTEGSPLYIEDLMRLTAVVKSAKEAIEKWKTKAGSEARKYALGRECELLGADARHVLLASCVASGPVSFAEVEGVTGLSTERVTAALSELQVLFLIPKPRLIEGEQRFEVNVNTRALVRDTFGSTDLYRRTETAYRTLSKGLPVTGRGAVAAIVRQAVFLVKGSKHVEGEALLLNALQKYESDPDLLGVLGWVYKAWHPPRVIDARERFNRASQLRASRTEMYEHWCQMELREHEWSKAAEAAERGLKILSNNKTLLYYAGYSRGRLGRELLGGLHGTRAQKELDTAKSTLKRALSVSSLDAREKALNADIFRALVLVCELTGDIDGMRHYFRRWTTEYPEDPDASSEWERISRKHRLGSISNAIT